MDYLTALVLGIVQGLTEFLPVSSSGHLEIIKGIFPTDFDSKESLIMTVVLHFATALSTIFIFRKEIFQIISGVFSKKSSKEKRAIEPTMNTTGWSVESFKILSLV